MTMIMTMEMDLDELARKIIGGVLKGMVNIFKPIPCRRIPEEEVTSYHMKPCEGKTALIEFNYNDVPDNNSKFTVMRQCVKCGATYFLDYTIDRLMEREPHELKNKKEERDEKCG